MATTFVPARDSADGTKPYVIPTYSFVRIDMGLYHRIITPYGQRDEWGRSCRECSDCGTVTYLGTYATCDVGGLCYVCSDACKAAHAAAFDGVRATHEAMTAVMTAQRDWTLDHTIHHNQGVLMAQKDGLYPPGFDISTVLIHGLFSDDPYSDTPLFGPAIPEGWQSPAFSAPCGCDHAGPCTCGEIEDDEQDEEPTGPQCQHWHDGKAHGTAHTYEMGTVESSTPNGLAYLCDACANRCWDSGELWLRKPRQPAQVCDGCYEPFYRTDMTAAVDGGIFCDDCLDGPVMDDYPSDDFGPADSDPYEGDRDEYEPGGRYFERDEYPTVCMACSRDLPADSQAFAFCPFCGSRLDAAPEPLPSRDNGPCMVCGTYADTAHYEYGAILDAGNAPATGHASMCSRCLTRAMNAGRCWFERLTK